MVVLLIAVSLPGAARADGQCGDGWYGQGDPRVPLTACTPWEKPTWEEWQAGWKIMRPGTMIKSLPTRLTPGANNSTGFGIELCYLDVPDDPRHPWYAQRCIGVDVRAVRLDHWCQRLRLLEGPTAKVPWLEVAGLCGQPSAVARVTEVYRNGRLARIIYRGASPG